MKKINFLSSIMLLLLCSITLLSKAQDTEISGQIRGLSDGIVKISYNRNGVFKTDSVKAIKDQFTWKAKLDMPQLIGFQINQNSISFLVEPGHTKVTGVKDSMGEFKISGSKIQQDAQQFAASITDLMDQANALSLRFQKASAEERIVLRKKQDELNEERKRRANQFIADNPKSFYSAYLIASRNSDPYDEIKPLYDLLDESVKRNGMGKNLAKKLEILEKSLIGKQIADFVQTDTAGKPVKFSSFRGKYVLIDFWASWCAPCRAENPNVLKSYNEFKDKGFTVVGISLDDKALNWKKAIHDDKMPWTQLSDLKGWKNEVSTSFGIQAVPSNFLIDPNGKIIAKDLRGPMLESKLKQLLN